MFENHLKKQIDLKHPSNLKSAAKFPEETSKKFLAEAVKYENQCKVLDLKYAEYQQKIPFVA